MRARAELFWRLLPDVRTGERTRFLFFAGLFTLISFAQTVGLAGSEALLLGTLGARGAAAHLHLRLARDRGGIDRATPRWWEGSATTISSSALLVRSAAALGIGAALAGAGVVSALIALVCLFYLTQAVFLNHFWTFSGDYFDTLASKRLVPLFTIGSSLGGVLGRRAGGGGLPEPAAGLAGRRLGRAARAPRR